MNEKWFSKSSLNFPNQVSNFKYGHLKKKIGKHFVIGLRALDDCTECEAYGLVLGLHVYDCGAIMILLMCYAQLDGSLSVMSASIAVGLIMCGIDIQVTDSGRGTNERVRNRVHR